MASLAPPYERLILHIGQAKTGTTSLQRSLSASRRHLAQRGVHYPRLPGHRDAHHTLMPALFGAAEAGPYIQHLLDRDPKRAVEKSQAALTALRHDSPDGADTLFLSSESFFRDMGPAKQARVEDMLRGLAKRIELVAFIREPASFYLSALGTHLQAYRLSLVPPPMGRRKALRSYMGWVDEIQIVPLEGIDSVAYVSQQYGFDLPVRAVRNTAISPEAMELFFRYARRHGRGEGGRPKGRALLFREALRRLDRVMPGLAKPRLNSGLREEIWKASSDLIWLRDTFGITFAGGPYELAGQGATFPFADVTSVASICGVNQDRLDRMARLLRPLA